MKRFDSVKIAKPLIGATMLAFMLCTPAFAQDELGVSMRFDRKPHDLGEAKTTKTLVDGAHTFPNNTFVGGSYELGLPAGEGKPAHKAEAILGYKWKQTDMFSTKFSAGIGERWGSNADSFPFYVFRAGESIKLNDTWTWDAITYRFREAFDTDHNYTTPEISSRLVYRLDDHNAISAGYYYDWKEGNADYQGIDIGYKYRF